MKEKNFLSNLSELGIIIFATAILFILFVPIPAYLLDLLLIINFSWALTILLLTFYIDKPLSFSTFPALLLMSTLFRLALNISATRLILSQGDAGEVIKAIGQYVIQGNYVMGMVVFLILIIVQFIVVTNGAQRVAEVAARFTLDSMPGKQMSIDAELNMGLLSQEQAKLKRSLIEREANFYGAMDGASKFVKGDAIAAILIVLVDLLGGFAIGLVQNGLSFAKALQTYSLLTVGDGIVTQIPALIISTATGIIVTRAATDTRLGSEVIKQLSSYPKSLFIVCFCLFLLLFLKGLPFVPVFLILICFVVAAYLANRSQATTEEVPATSETLYDKIKIYPLELHLNAQLFIEFSKYETQFYLITEQLRERIACEVGLIIPEVKIRTDKKLNYPTYALAIQGAQQNINALHLSKVLAIVNQRTKPREQITLNSIKDEEPSYGLPGFWIDEQLFNEAKEAGYTLCQPLEILSTHLYESVQNHLAQLLTRKETEILLEQSHLQSLRDELIPGILPITQVQRVLQNLLDEKVPIRHLDLILEVLLEHGKNTQNIAHLTELVRSRLSSPICQKLINSQGILPVLTLTPTLEQTLTQNIVNEQLILEPSLMEQLLMSLSTQVEKMLNDRIRPVLLCSSLLRRHIRHLTSRILPHLSILSMSEIPINVQVESYQIVK